MFDKSDSSQDIHITGDEGEDAIEGVECCCQINIGCQVSECRYIQDSFFCHQVGVGVHASGVAAGVGVRTGGVNVGELQVAASVGVRTGGVAVGVKSQQSFINCVNQVICYWTVAVWKGEIIFRILITV